MDATNKKTVVIYKSKYGNAKRYAEWIADAAGADLFEGSKVKASDYLKYETIVFGGSLYAVGILGISLIKKNFDKIKDKKVIIFSVGASPAHPEALEHVKSRNLTPEMQEKVHYFHLRGGFDYKRLGLLDKLLMNMLRKRIESKKEEERTNDEKGMLASFARPVDWKSKEAITPIVECIKTAD